MASMYRYAGQTRHRVLVALIAACLVGAGGQAWAGLGDPFFPGTGNRGYDVLRYDVALAYSPGSGKLRARARIVATASARLRRFSLDLDGLRVSAVTVDGSPARFSRGADKLTVVPARAVAAGASFHVLVRYRGRPQRVTDPDGSSEGWIRTEDGAVALGEPTGTASWLPCNNTPTDKAAFRFEITVPGPLKGVANGRLLGVRRDGGRSTFVWGAPEPMAPYLAMIAIGRGRLDRSRIAGISAWTLVDPRLAAGARPALRRLPAIVRFLSRSFGPYPFDAIGSVVDLAPVDYALETQTRPIYTSAPGSAGMVHEMAHQWFGDSVGLTRWPEIWLNEGFATWAEWYYAERSGGKPAARTFARLYRTPASDSGFWNPPPGRLGSVRNLFANSLYLRGAMAVQALRTEIGTDPLLEILRRWTTDHRFATATIPDFIALAEEVSGMQLDQLFDDWLYRRGKPRGYD